MFLYKNGIFQSLFILKDTTFKEIEIKILF